MSAYRTFNILSGGALFLLGFTLLFTLVGTLLGIILMGEGLGLIGLGTV
jgi:hypothetical protein